MKRSICVNDGKYFIAADRRRLRRTKFQEGLPVRSMNCLTCCTKCAIEWNRKRPVYKRIVLKAIKEYNERKFDLKKEAPSLIGKTDYESIFDRIKEKREHKEKLKKVRGMFGMERLK